MLSYPSSTVWDYGKTSYPSRPTEHLVDSLCTLYSNFHNLMILSFVESIWRTLDLLFTNSIAFIFSSSSIDFK